MSVLLSRRTISLGAPMLGGAFARHALADTGACTTIPDSPTAERPPPQTNADDFSRAEVQLAVRNHGFQLEAGSQPITPLGEHYLLTHFDTQFLSSDGYSVALGGYVANPQKLSLQNIMARRSFDQVVTMECAGVGRRALAPRPVYVPWDHDAIGTYRWTGTPLRPLLEQAGVMPGAVEVVFSGWDHGVDLGIEHVFERSLPIDEAMRDEVMLAWAHNGESLLPEHGFPLRLVVPSWYGMASVKWLRAITVLPQPFQGVEQTQVYIYQSVKDGPYAPVQQKRVNSVMVPPGSPDVLSRTRFVRAGKYTLEGKAWSGHGSITAVEVSTDGGGTWQQAHLSPVSSDPYAWVSWSANWTAQRGSYTLLCRAQDDAGNVQPVDPGALWNLGGNGAAASDRTNTVVLPFSEDILAHVPCIPKRVVPGAKVPPPISVFNTAV